MPDYIPISLHPKSGDTIESSEWRDSVTQETTVRMSNSPVQRPFAESPDRIDSASHVQGRSLSIGSDIAASDLQYIAAELSCLKPRKCSAVEEAELVKDDHQITLGFQPIESTGTHKSHRRPMSLSLSRVLPPKILETGNNLEGGHSRSPSVKASPSVSPLRALSRTSSVQSVKLADNDTALSRSEHSNYSRSKGTLSGASSPEKLKSSSASGSASSPEKTKNASVLEIRSSEQEPSVHQTNIPTLNNFLLPARLCYMLDAYRQVDQNFDFFCLVGMNRCEIESTVRQDLALGGDSTFSPKRNLSHQQITQAHTPILENFLKCSDDLVLEGFFHELANVDEPKRNGRYDSASEKSTQDRIEIAIFSSDYSRQFLVVFQGSVDMQAKSVWNQNDQKVRGSPQESILSDTQPVTVFTPFRNAYFQSNLEEQVFQKLDELIQTHPFFDVIMSGFSFGGALASLASLRYAAANPMLLVSCFTFSCPKIGALNFRYYVNSLPNLKVST